MSTPLVFALLAGICMAPGMSPRLREILGVVFLVAAIVSALRWLT